MKEQTPVGLPEWVIKVVKSCKDQLVIGTANKIKLTRHTIVVYKPTSDSDKWTVTLHNGRKVTCFDVVAL